MSVAVRREQVNYARQRGLSCRRACKLVGVARSSLGYEPKQPRKDSLLLARLREVAAQHPRWGYRRVRAAVSTESQPVSFKRVYRVWRQGGLCLPKRRPRKRVRSGQHRWMSAIAPNGIWAYDFVFDACANGQKLKCLVVIDEWTRECLAIEVGGRLSSRRVVDVLSRLVSLYGAPSHLRSDNGPEFIAETVKEWLKQENIATAYIDPGRPWQNGMAESFIGRFRDECLNREWFLNRRDAKTMIEAWRSRYNHEHPHSGLGYETPAQRRAGWLAVSRATNSTVNPTQQPRGLSC